MIFTDYGSETLVVTNGASDTFTAPYKCMVILSDFRFDDTNDGRVEILDLNIIQSGGRTSMFIFKAPINDDDLGGCSHILRSGQRLRADANDDFRVTVNYFRLPA